MSCLAKPSTIGRKKLLHYYSPIRTMIFCSRKINQLYNKCAIQLFTGFFFNSDLRKTIRNRIYLNI